MALDYEAIEALIAQALAATIAAGVRVRQSGREQGWAIEKVDVPDGEWCNQDYLLWGTADLEWILATYGNNDAGVGPRSQTALVLPVAVLQDAAGEGSSTRREFTMRLLTCETNEWGYT